MSFILNNFATITIAFFILILVVVILIKNVKMAKKNFKNKTFCSGCKKNCKFNITKN